MERTLSNRNHPQINKGTWMVTPIKIEHDAYIMDLAVEHCDQQDLKSINVCRMHLQIVTIADIATHDGNRIHNGIYQGEKDTG